jgi:hypothetical protein
LALAMKVTKTKKETTTTNAKKLDLIITVVILDVPIKSEAQIWHQHDLHTGFFKEYMFLIFVIGLQQQWQWSSYRSRATTRSSSKQIDPILDWNRRIMLTAGACES